MSQPGRSRRCAPSPCPRRREPVRRYLRRLAAVADGSRGRRRCTAARQGAHRDRGDHRHDRPVFIGDEVTCYAQIVKVGRTSITVKVESWVRRGIGEEQIAVTEGIFTYVAIDEDRRPRPVPPDD
jgi:hypothetical protein